MASWQRVLVSKTGGALQVASVGPAAAVGTAAVAWRVSAADTLAITFQTLAINLTPSAGSYRILAFRS